jgi:hypothetical protein
MFSENRTCSRCIHSIRVGRLGKSPHDITRVPHDVTLRCTYEAKWVTVSPKHFCGHFQLDTAQEEVPFFEANNAPVEYREDASESIQ